MTLVGNQIMRWKSCRFSHGLPAEHLEYFPDSNFSINLYVFLCDIHSHIIVLEKTWGRSRHLTSEMRNQKEVRSDFLSSSYS